MKKIKIHIFIFFTMICFVSHGQDKDSIVEKEIDSSQIAFEFVNQIAKEKGEYKKFNYKSGQLSSEGYLVDKQPLGKWISYHETSKIKSIGILWNNHPVGEWGFYNSDGIINKLYNYDSTGLLHGKVNIYDSIGCIKKTIYYEHGIKQGPVKEYFKDGSLKKVAYYKDDNLEGNSFEYSEEDGRLLSEKVYKKGDIAVNAAYNRFDENGKKTGFWRQYYNDGSIKIEAKYKEGILDGVYKEYKKNGQLRLLTSYEKGIENEEAKNDLKIDYYRKYYNDGSLHLFGLLKNNKKNGVIREYDKDENIINGYIYKEDTLLSEGIIDKKGEYQGPWKIYYTSGELKAEGKYINNLKDSVWIFYFRDGKIEQKGGYDNGDKKGTWRWYFKNGDLRKEEYYRRGKLDGEAIEYDTSRNIIVKGLYLDGNEEGEWFYDVGDHLEKGQFEMGLKTGEWIHYYPNGKKKFKGSFRNGLAIDVHIYYHTNGVKSLKGIFKRGKKDGVWKQFDKMGEKTHYIEYNMGKEVRIDGIKVKE